MGHEAGLTAVHGARQLQLLAVGENVAREAGNTPGERIICENTLNNIIFCLDKPSPYFPTFSAFVNFFTEQTFIFRTLDKENTRVKIK